MQKVIRASGQRACLWRHGTNGGSTRYENCSGRGPLESLNVWRQDQASLSGLSQAFTSGRTLYDDALHTPGSPLQFLLEGLASPPVRPMRAFERVVCVPFQETVSMSTRVGLERQVRQLVCDILGRTGPHDLQSIATHLARHGLNASVAYPAKLRTPVPLFTPFTSLPFLIVTSDESSEVVVVDSALREHLAVAPSTAAYQRTMTTTVPELFIGTRARLQQLITAMSAAISLNFASQGIDVPPWRRTSALLGRWVGVEERERQLLHTRGQVSQKRGRGPAVVSPLSPGSIAEAPSGALTGVSVVAAPEQATGRYATTEGAVDRGVLEERQALSEGKVHGGCAVSTRPAVVVVGFQIGNDVSAAAQSKAQGTWSGVRPGGLAALCRQQTSSLESSGACTDGGGSMDSGVALVSPPLSVYGER